MGRFFVSRLGALFSPAETLQSPSAVRTMFPVRNRFGPSLLVLPILILSGRVEGWLDVQAAFRVPPTWAL